VNNGTIISHYTIQQELGRGGMGVVYKASDTKLDRTVALKVLPPHALTSEDDQSRFYREARAAAALHHPHIATVFEIDEHEGQPFIAMEFIDGQALDDKIAEGPLALDAAVTIASQIAQGLKAAHAKNIVHRDIKSANVMLTGDGTAKILDFGLAKTAASTKLTQLGSTLGTVAYMSPEQARSQDVDHRSDLWSLGIVLYEMIAGKLPFVGDFEQAIVYSILHEEPKPLTAVRTGVPMGLEWIVSKLLAKDPADRYQSATDLLVDLRTVDLKDAGLSRVRSGPLEGSLAGPTTTDAPDGGRRRFATTILTFLAGIAVAGAAWALWPESEPYTETSVKQFDLTLHGLYASPGMDISPDGSTLVYISAQASGNNVFVRDLATGATRLIRGSDGTFVVSISPDGQWVLLTKQLSIERVSLFEGAPLLVTETNEGGPRASWGPDGWIIFEDDRSIWKLNLDTGEKQPLTQTDSTAHEIDHDWPQMLPDGKTVMATIEFSNAPSAIGFWDFETGERRGQVLIDGYRPKYLDTGHLLAVLGPQGGNLVAIPFDIDNLEATGPPMAVAADVDPRMTTVSNGGTLLTARRQNSNLLTSTKSKLARVTLPNNLTPLVFEPAIYRGLDLSPDGSRVVVSLLSEEDDDSASDGANEDIWVLDLERETRNRLTSGGTGSDPTWWPGGDSVAYIDRRRMSSLGATAKVRAADGSGSARDLFTIKSWIADIAISPSGSRAAYVVGGRYVAATKLIVIDLATGQSVDLSGDEAASYRHPEFSPDGRYIAYQKDDRVWATEATGTGVPHYVGLAQAPRWSSDGTRIFVRDGTSIIYFGVTYEPTFSIVRSGFDIASGFGQSYLFDVFEDGETALVNVLETSDDEPDGSGSVRDSSLTVTVTVNWLETLK
jgi:serine/threonine protein kinase/Tol biopolymer transport system component